MLKYASLASDYWSQNHFQMFNYKAIRQALQSIAFNNWILQAKVPMKMLLKLQTIYEIYLISERVSFVCSICSINDNNNYNNVFNKYKSLNYLEIYRMS